MDAMQPDRRAVTRLPGTSIKLVRICSEAGESAAKVRDVSIAGIGLLLRQPLELGTWLTLEPTQPRRRMSPPLRAEVRQTTRADGDFLIGCRFSRLLTLDDMMTLG